MKAIKKILQNSIFEVFEKMFFVFLECSERGRPEYEWAVSINFSGDKSGKLIAYFTDDISNMMVQNMLSVAESGVTPKLREDCMKESVNMMGGDFLRNFDSSKVFDLSLPLVENGPGGVIMTDETDEEDKIALVFESDGGALGVMLMFR
jgi:CheY-specific phosphatase CheX